MDKNVSSDCEKSPNEKFDWPKEAILRLIHLWKEEQCLYNIHHKLYNNTIAKQISLNKLSKAMKEWIPNCSARHVKKKIANLRCQYTREISKISLSRTSGGKEYIPNLLWFSYMSFLNDYIRVRKKKNSSKNDKDLSSCTWEDTASNADIRAESKKFKPETSFILASGKDEFLCEEECASSASGDYLAGDVLPEHSTPVKDDYLDDDLSSENRAGTPKSSSDRNLVDETFLQYIAAEMSSISGEDKKAELRKNIVLLIFDAKT